VTFITPTGRIRGWDDVKRDWYVGYLQHSFVERRLSAVDLFVNYRADSAEAVFQRSFSGKLADGKSFKSTGWETQIYRKTPIGWRLEHVQYSGGPPEAPAPGIADAQ
jgi:hypothetical protein